MESINLLKKYFENIIQSLNNTNINRIFSYLKQIPILCEINKNSLLNRSIRDTNSKHYHPVKVKKGDIYNAKITENAGSELSDNHLVIIIQGISSNIYGEKVTVLPIEGDGKKINPHYQIPLTNADLENGQLDKDPSRIVYTDIITIDKARLNGRIGYLKPTKIEEINKKLVMHLELKKG